MTTFTCDVSNHDYDRGAISWNSVRAAGIDLAVAKASEGDPSYYHYLDPYFTRSVASGRLNGVRMGGYHCLAHGSAASIERQVDLFLTLINNNGGVNPGYWMIDVEPFPELKNRGMAPLLDDVLRFEDLWLSKTNGVPLLHYIPKWYWEEWGSPSLSSIHGPLVASNYPVSASQAYTSLYARDGGDSGPGWQPYGGKTPSLWQFASSASIPGIAGNADCNAFKGTVSDFVKLTSRRTATPPPPARFPSWPGRVLINTSPVMHGSDVSTWQRQMQDRGWSITVDGYYQSQSETVCRRFQTEKGLIVDGKVGRITWDAAWTSPIT